MVIATGSIASVLAAAGPAAAAGTVKQRPADATPSINCTSSRPDLAAALSRDIGAALNGRASTTALALYDRTTGTRCTLDADKKFDSASVVKVTVLATLLRQAKEENRVLTSREVALSTAMITRSDNTATSALWKQLGIARINRFLKLAGMTQTVPGADGYWGLTQTTAGDQLVLMSLLTSDNPVLGRASRDYALRLMNKVVPEQRWGAPAGVPDGVTVQVKNGWLPRATHAWRVHSVGAFTGNGHDYAIVVLTQDSSTMDYGVATIQAVAREIHRDLNPGLRANRQYASTPSLPGTPDAVIPPLTGGR